MLIHRHAVTRVLGFYLIHSAVYNASLNQQCHVIKIEIAPLESQDLAHPKPQIVGDGHH